MSTTSNTVRQHTRTYKDGYKTTVRSHTRGERRNDIGHLVFDFDTNTIELRARRPLGYTVYSGGDLCGNKRMWCEAAINEEAANDIDSYDFDPSEVKNVRFVYINVWNQNLHNAGQTHLERDEIDSVLDAIKARMPKLWSHIQNFEHSY